MSIPAAILAACLPAPDADAVAVLADALEEAQDPRAGAVRGLAVVPLNRMSADAPDVTAVIVLRWCVVERDADGVNVLAWTETPEAARRELGRRLRGLLTRGCTTCGGGGHPRGIEQTFRAGPFYLRGGVTHDGRHWHGGVQADHAMTTVEWEASAGAFDTANYLLAQFEDFVRRYACRRECPDCDGRGWLWANIVTAPAVEPIPVPPAATGDYRDLYERIQAEVARSLGVPRSLIGEPGERTP